MLELSLVTELLTFRWLQLLIASVQMLYNFPLTQDYYLNYEYRFTIGHSDLDNELFRLPDLEMGLSTAGVTS
jgi:hypothetical protein